jgi:hypothetical protein
MGRASLPDRKPESQAATRICEHLHSKGACEDAFGFSSRVRLLHKQPMRPRAIENGASVIKEGSEDPRSGWCQPQVVSVELEKVVSGGDQAPFRPDGRPASSFEALHPPVRLDLGEHRLDHALSS